MNRLMLMVVMTVGALAVQAMPTKAELTEAQPLVGELMAEDVAAFKAKTKTAEQVGDVSVKYAESAETEAARFLLLKGAVSYYVRAEAYDKAADAVANLQRTIKDVSPAAVAEIVGKATGKISETKAPRLYAQYRAAKLQVNAEGEAKALAVKLKKVKSDALQRKYAEALAISGDWKAAYAEFAKVGDAKLKAIVEAESKGAAKNVESGEFWWAYKPAMEDADDFFKAHAAAFYQKALASGEISGLKKNIVEKRIAGIAAESTPVVGQIQTSAATPSVVAAPVTSASSAGKAWQVNGNSATLTLNGGVKIEFVKCPAGSFDMYRKFAPESMQQVSITRPFWISKTCLSYNQLRGINPQYEFSDKDANAAAWQDYGSLAEGNGSACGRLTGQFGDCLPSGMVFRLPSVAEYEYASVIVPKSVGDVNLTDWRNGGADGRFDLLLDRYSEANVTVDSKDASRILGYACSLEAKDPFFWSEDANALYAAKSWKVYKQVGLRPAKAKGHAHIVVGPDLVSEWKAKRGEKSAPSSGKAWQENGNSATLTLPSGEKLEFVKCPAGTVDYRIGCNDWEKYNVPCFKKVKITRPFWIMTRPLARRNFKGYPEDATMWGDRKDDSIYNYPQGRHLDFESFAGNVTGDVQDSLPKGYVVRLPSFAEWDYAIRANSRDPEDIYSTFDSDKDDINGKIFNNHHNGKSPKNKWGIHEYSREQLLDRISDENAWFKVTEEKNGKPYTLLVHAMKNADQISEDPLLWSDKPDAIAAHRQSKSWMCLTGNCEWDHARLVVGPDLVSEWKAKHGKK